MLQWYILRLLWACNKLGTRRLKIMNWEVFKFSWGADSSKLMQKVAKNILLSGFKSNNK